MRKTLLCMLTLFSIFVLSSFPLAAQDGEPEEVQTVIQTLENALAADIDPAMIDNIVWRDVTFSTTALGCPFPGSAYEPLDSPGYQVLVDYEGVRYDYRVTTGSEYVILCGTQQTNFIVPAEPMPEVISTVATVPDTPDTTCADALAPRLGIGETARTTPLLGSNIRETPDLNGVEVGLVPESTEFVVIDGPECGAAGNYWWNVEYAGVTGWVVQGQNGLYFVEPIPQPLIATTNSISQATLNDVALLGQIEGNLLGISAWSPDGQRLVMGDASTENPSLWIYFIDDLSQVPVSVSLAHDVTALAFNGDGSLLAVGDPDGTVHLYETESYSEIATIDAHDTAVLSIEFSPAGNYMVVVDDNYSAAFYGVVTP